MKPSEVVFVAIDVETTGYSAGNRIIEISIIGIENLKIADKFTTFVNPQVPIPTEIVRLTGIADEDVKDAPTFKFIANNILNLLDNKIIVAHNATFDIGTLNAELKRLDMPTLNGKFICSLRLARRLYPHLPKKSLQFLTEYFNLKTKRNHRAEDDALAAANLFLIFLEELKIKHNIFSLEEIFKFQNLPPRAIVNPYIEDKILESISNAPAQPGVYFYKDQNENILYVGKAKNLKSRLSSYINLNFNSKSFEIVKESSSLSYIALKSPLSAELKEAEFIEYFKPKFNEKLVKKDSPYFLKINLSEDFPKFKITRKFSFDENDYYGPFPNLKKTQAFSKLINKIFLLRECDEEEFNNHSACYLRDLNRCLAPCEDPNKTNYFKEINKALDFLSGNKNYATNYLSQKLKLYTQSKRYEDAAEVRDMMNFVLSQSFKFSIIAEPINKAKFIAKIYSNFGYSLFLFFECVLLEIDSTNEDYFKSFIEEFYNSHYNSKNILSAIGASINLRKIKIFLSYLARNKDLISIYYLKQFNSSWQLLKKIYE